MNDYLIFGATGLTGKNLLQLVKEDGASYHLFVRNFLDSEKEQNQTIFNQHDIPELPNSKSLIICLGYPLTFKELVHMDKQTKESFKQVDLDLVSKIARMAIKKDISNIAVISAVGSSINSSNFYLKIKSKMEKQILDLKFKKTIFAKPGHLLGPRDPSRVDQWVRIIEILGRIYGIFLIGPLKKYKNIDATMVASEILSMIKEDNPDSNYLIEFHENL